jgi:hypothetical protein
MESVISNGPFSQNFSSNTKNACWWCWLSIESSETFIISGADMMATKITTIITKGGNASLNNLMVEYPYQYRFLCDYRHIITQR